MININLVRYSCPSSNGHVRQQSFEHRSSRKLAVPQRYLAGVTLASARGGAGRCWDPARSLGNLYSSLGRHTFAGTRAHCFAVPSFIITHHGPSLQSAGNAANSNSCRVPGACSYDLGCNISFSRERQMLTHSTWMGKQPVSGNR